MRNLKLCNIANIQFPCEPIGICTDNDNEIIYIIDTCLKLYYRYNSTGSKISVKELDDRLNRNDQSLVSISQVRLVEFLVETACILLVLKNGQIILFDLRENIVDTILRHPSNIHAFKFSPDQNLIALLDENNELFILSHEFEIRHKTNVILNNTSLNQPVGVGWGSKETQFFGLDGRPARERLNVQNRNHEDRPVDDGTGVKSIISTEQYQTMSAAYRTPFELDWHGDGRLLVTLAKLDNGKHQVKVWNRNLELQFMSDQLFNMETGLASWIPNGQYICCAQILEDDSQDIALFERNGLVHQRFTLPFRNSHLFISQLSWSKDSRIFAVLGLEYKYVGDNLISNWILMLYTCNNFRWYLKYVSYLDNNDSVFKICWSESNFSQFMLFSSNGVYEHYDCQWIVSSSEKHSTVAVIDGCQLSMTPFKVCSVPPPMSAIDLTFSDFVQEIAFSDTFKSLLLTSSGNAIFIQESHMNNQLIQDDNIKVESKLSHAQQIASSISYRLWNQVKDLKLLTHWTFITDDHVIAVKNSINENPKLVYTSSSQFRDIKYKFTFPECGVVNVSGDPKSGLAAIVTNEGSIYRVVFDKSNSDISVKEWKDDSGTELVIPSLGATCTTQCAKIEGTPRIISLSKDLTLRIDDTVITSNNCTSFAVTDSYIIYTTTENLMRCQLLKRVKSQTLTDWTRNIENGAFLVSANEINAKVVLQMPRGNLEIIYPRVLLFNLLVKLLEEKKFIGALDLVRRHRINMNFIADYLNDWFMDPENLNKFAREVGLHDATWLNLFLSELNDEDTIATQYKSIVEQLPVQISDDRNTSSKVNRICQSLDLENDLTLLQPYLICLLKQQPKRVDHALIKIKSLGDKGEKALRFVLYMIDIEKLFQEALGTYDSSVALMVANISHKDPKEYLSLINDFDIIENKDYRRYKIDSYIKRYDKALVNMLNFYKDNKESKYMEELYTLVVDKRLWKETLKLLESSTDVDLNDMAKIVWHAYAKYLSEKRYYIESGIANEMADDPQSAIKSYLMDAEWSRALTVAAKLQTNSLEAYKNIARYLLADSKFNEAANIFENFCDDHQGAYQAYIQGRSFCSANRLVIKYKLAGEPLKEAIISHAQEIIHTMNASLETNRNHLSRLQELRDELEKKRSQQGAGENCTFLDGDTLSTVDGSEASSQTSDTSRSGASSIKTRKPNKGPKAPRKKNKISLKVGSRYEDVSLLTELKSFLVAQNNYLEDGRSICCSIYDMRLYIEHRDLISKINRSTEECYKFATQVLDRIWPLDTSKMDSLSVYKVFAEKQNSSDYTIDEIDLELLVRPKMPLCFSPFIL